MSWFTKSPQYKELDGLDGEPVEFEWRIFPGHTTLQILREIQKLMGDWDCTREEFPGRIIFVSMFNDIICGNEGNELTCLENSPKVSDYARRFAVGRWSFLGPGSETKRRATDSVKPAGEWDSVAAHMLKNLGQSGHPIFRATSALDRGQLKGNGSGKKSIHFCACESDHLRQFFALLFLQISSVFTEQSQIYVKNFLKHWPVLNKTYVVEEQSELMVAPTDLYGNQKFPANELERGDPVHSHQQRLQNLSDEAQLIKLSTDAGFVKAVALGQFSMTRDAEEFVVGDHIGCREYTLKNS